MSNKVPDEVAKTIKQLVYSEADNFHYLSRSRPDNGRFIERLVASQDIGGVLRAYMDRAEVKTYIKDAILNRYAKDKRINGRPNDILSKCKAFFDLNDLLESDSEADLILFKSSQSSVYIVVSEGTYLKWETALRKALLYVASHPFGQNGKNHIHLVLSLFARNRRIPESDKALLRNALENVSAKVIFWGE